MDPPAAEWLLREPDAALLDRLESSEPGASLLPLARRLLALRLRDESAADYLEPRLAALEDPMEIGGMEAAAQRILLAVERRESVILYGDYDVDGITSLALITILLRAYGLEPRSFLPHRMEEGYGLSAEGLARCFEEHGAPGLLVALDCGTNAVAEAGMLRQRGVDCVIVDHHEPGGALPDCVALVNPKVSGAPAPLCTAGLSFKLMHAALKLKRLPDFDLREHLDLAAMGTVADLVPLRGDNRVIVRKGLERIAATKRVGLRALKAAAGVSGHVEASHIGFRLGPRLNASGRLDHARASLDLLLCDDEDEAQACAGRLNTLNRERQEVENLAHREARAIIESDPALARAPCIVLGSRDWHPGVVGIVAARVMRDFHRPAVMFAFDGKGFGKGSGRSLSGVSLVEALDECRPLLLKGGGHAMAVGITIEEVNFAEFSRALIRAVERQLDGAELRRRCEFDAECSLAEFGPDFYRQFAQLEPFGMGNPEPVFLVRNVDPSLPGQIMKEKHWKLWLRQNGHSAPALWFNAPLGAAPPPPWDIGVKLQRQFWRGVESWIALILEARAAEPGPVSVARA